jgi:hypothetical protein
MKLRQQTGMRQQVGFAAVLTLGGICGSKRQQTEKLGNMRVQHVAANSSKYTFAAAGTSGSNSSKPYEVGLLAAKPCCPTPGPVVFQEKSSAPPAGRK